MGYTVGRRVLRKYLLRYRSRLWGRLFFFLLLTNASSPPTVISSSSTSRCDTTNGRNTHTISRSLIHRAISLSARTVRDCSDGFSPDVKMSRCPWHGAREKMDDRTGLGTALATVGASHLGSLFGERVIFGPLVFRYSARDTMPLISAPMKHTGLKARLISVAMVDFRRLYRKWIGVTRWLFDHRYYRVNVKNDGCLKSETVVWHHRVLQDIWQIK